jgi:hypothetical protein
MRNDLRVLLLVGVWCLQACSMGPTQADLAVARQMNAQRRDQEMQSTRANLQKKIRTTSLPTNYQQVIDAYFVNTLKDPDSRRIVYGSNPYGSLVCGTVNARNSFGGYTGQQPFYAYFTADGEIAELVIYTPRELEAAREWKRNYYASTYEMLRQAVLLEECNLL